MQFYIDHRHQRQRAQLGIVAQFRIIVPQQFADPRPGARPYLWPQRHERVQRRPGEYTGIADIKTTVQLQFAEIEHVVADRNANARREPAL